MIDMQKVAQNGFQLNNELPMYLKYSGSRGGAQHGNGTLHWNNQSSIPFRSHGETPLLKGQEYNNLQRVVDFQSALFSMDNTEDKARFDEIYDKHANGWYKVCHRVEHWNESKQCLVVWLEWLQVYVESPAQTRAS